MRAITDALDSDRITMDDIAVATSVARKLDLSKPILLLHQFGNMYPNFVIW